MKSIPTSTLSQTKTDTLNAPQRTTPPRSWRTLAGQWDLFAVIGLMVGSAAYGICAVAGVA